MFNYIKRLKLSRLTKPENSEYDGTQKQNIVLSQLALLVALITFIHLIDDLVAIRTGTENIFLLSLIEGLLFAISIITYLLNESGKHNLAKHTLLLSVNILLFFLNSVTPKESGSYFFFFPLMAATFIFYGYSDEIKRNFYLILTASLFIILTLVDFDLFGVSVQMDTDYDFLTNLLSSMILMVLTIRFLVKLNKKTESNLFDNQNKMRVLMDDLNSKNQRLEKANAELDQFAYSVSHDLRAPLRSMLGLINLSFIDDSKSAHTEHLNMMKEMVEKLDKFIHEIIDYSRNVKLEIDTSVVDLKSLTEEVISDLQLMDGWKEIDFQVAVDVESPFKSDRSRLSIILNNLISNAIKYHDFSETKPFIRITAFSQGNARSISVADNGQGIEESLQPKIFDMFFRGNEKATGSGLGLYIVKEIVAKLGGDLTFESRPFAGTTFTVTFTDQAQLLG